MVICLSGEEEEVLGVADVGVLQQRAVEHVFQYRTHAVLAVGGGDAQEGFAAVFHDGFHIVEIDVLTVGHGDDFRDTLHCVLEDVIHLGVSLVDRQ